MVHGEGAWEQDAQGFKSGLVCTMAFVLSVPDTSDRNSPSCPPLLLLLGPNQSSIPASLPLALAVNTVTMLMGMPCHWWAGTVGSKQGLQHGRHCISSPLCWQCWKCSLHHWGNSSSATPDDLKWCEVGGPHDGSSAPKSMELLALVWSKGVSFNGCLSFNLKEITTL